MRSLFCTVNAQGEFYTIGLRIPEEGGGDCKVISVSPAVISGPTEPRDVLIPTSVGETTIRDRTSGKMVALTGPLAPVFYFLKEVGDVTTLGGVTYKDCRVVTRQRDGIIVVNSQGVIKILFADLSPDVQKKFASP